MLNASTSFTSSSDFLSSFHFHFLLAISIFWHFLQTIISIQNLIRFSLFHVIFIFSSLFQTIILIQDLIRFWFFFTFSRHFYDISIFTFCHFLNDNIATRLTLASSCSSAEYWFFQTMANPWSEFLMGSVFSTTGPTGSDDGMSRTFLSILSSRSTSLVRMKAPGSAWINSI